VACFLVPVGEAIVTTVMQKAMEHKEKKDVGEKTNVTGLKWSRRLGWLNKMLWGGSILLALEHVWHGEVVPWPPFLTAMANPADVAPMLHEIATVGVTMAIAVTAIWAIIVLIVELKAKAVLAVTEPSANGGE
jgi:hypothetical protein